MGRVDGSPGLDGARDPRYFVGINLRQERWPRWPGLLTRPKYSALRSQTVRCVLSLVEAVPTGCRHRCRTHWLCSGPAWHLCPAACDVREPALPCPCCPSSLLQLVSWPGCCDARFKDAISSEPALPALTADAVCRAHPRLRCSYACLQGCCPGRLPPCGAALRRKDPAGGAVVLDPLRSPCVGDGSQEPQLVGL